MTNRLLHAGNWLLCPCNVICGQTGFWLLYLRGTWNFLFPPCLIVLVGKFTTSNQPHAGTLFFYSGASASLHSSKSVCYDKETFFFYTITEDLFSSLTPQDTLSQLDGFRDFVFVISSILRILVIGNYLPSMSVLTQWMERRKKKHAGKITPALALCCHHLT